MYKEMMFSSVASNDYLYLKFCPNYKYFPEWGVDISGRRENIRKVGRRMNVVEILCTHV
jgi:hypothetical protein